ncbi:MAG: hybrid sensor histidine kinase/response regulator [Cyanobacteria bacterium P01_A01_bin.40]
MIIYQDCEMNSDRPTPDQGKILIVDDQLDNLRLLSEILIGNGYEVRKAINGSTALMGIKTFLPDLILLDINMPGLNGYEVCQKLKSDRVYKQIPIIFLSASNEVIDKVKAFEVGGIDYITKPFQVPEVLARVETQIKLRRFNQMRENLSRAIVHDLKNPLSIITLSSSSLIRRKCLEGRNLSALETINATAQRLDSLLNDLLMVAKMDADRLILHKTEVDLQELLNSSIISRFKIAAEAKQIKLLSQIPAVNPKISVDVNLFQRAIENLLSNALKFSPPHSEIILKVTYPQSSKVALSVIDQGIGVKSELHQEIFESYKIGEYIDDVSQIGLGLSFCKMVIEAHGGKISLQNNHPCGAIFTIELDV